MITIVDVGIGNVGSLKNMINRLGGDSLITDSKEELRDAEKIVLPGVGAFDNAMNALHKLDLMEVLDYKVLDEQIPILCICLGMHLITKGSEEGSSDGFGWIDGFTSKFKFDEDHSSGLKIPHMGWNTVSIEKPSRLFPEPDADQRFYFVHSYHVICNEEDDVLCTTNYGYSFVSAIEKENIFATQFHPEKSHKYGMNLIESFLNL